MARSLVRVVFCGAVDDGKSTLIGRLLAETGSANEDELESVTVDGIPDYSRLTDGLSAEREQGITIDVAYRHLALLNGGRALLADCPGHEQYTRNMAVAASRADVAVLVVDATRGPRPQSYRHAAICALMGVRRVIVAMTKTDAVPDPATAMRTVDDFASELAVHGFETISTVALSAIGGENVVLRSPIAQYDGPSLVELLGEVRDSLAGENEGAGPQRFPVQAVWRANDQRWYLGRLASGQLAEGDLLRVASSGATAAVAEIRSAGRDRQAGAALAIRLDRELDIRRGDLLIPDDEHSPQSRAHLADLIWLDLEPQRPGDSYLLRVGPLEVPARVDVVRYTRDVTSDEQQAVEFLRSNDLGRVEIVLDRPLLLDPYVSHHDTGGFILVDRLTARTVAAGMVRQPLVRESDVVRHRFRVTRADREAQNHLRGCVIWLTGLSGSGKSTVADALDARLHEAGIRSYTIDGDSVRAGLSEDLGFSPEDRAENVRRVARVAEMMLDAGLVVIVSLVSPFRSDRLLAREHFADTDFFEIFVDTPLDECIRRDPKGLYARAAADSTISLTGVSQAYERPEDPHLVIDGMAPTASSVARLLDLILVRRT